MQPPPPGAPPPGQPPSGAAPPGYPPPGYPPYGQPPKKSLLWLWLLLGIGGAVVVLAILAAVAIPSFLDYQRKAKRSEAELNLRAIGKAACAYFAENAQYPEASGGPIPAEPCCMQPGHRCQVDPAPWMREPWQSLDFELTAPGFYRYAYTAAPGGQGFTATATGDLDCDGEEVTFTITGTVDNGVPVVSEIVPPTNRD